MIAIIAAVVLLLLSVVCMTMQKSYAYIPARELKRRAEKHDPLASMLFRAAAYGRSLRLLLSLIIVISSSAGLVILVRALPVPIGLFVVVVVLALLFVRQSSKTVSAYETRLTALLTPGVAWVMNYCYPLLNRIISLAIKHPDKSLHTGVYERSDLLKLIERQKGQADNRIRAEDLNITEHSLVFDDHRVGDVLTAGELLKTVLSSDVIGPVLINELHENGQEFVLVRDVPDGPIVGTLAFKDLGIKATGHVRDVMNTRLHYVHEDDSLSKTLHVFFATYDPWLIVVNSQEEYVGVVSVQDVLSKLLGSLSSDDADQYADRSAVAARYRLEPETELVEDNEAVYNSEEVVE